MIRRRTEKRIMTNENTYPAVSSPTTVDPKNATVVIQKEAKKNMINVIR